MPLRGPECVLVFADGLLVDDVELVCVGVDVAVSAGGGPWTTADACGDGIYCMEGAVRTDAPRLRVRVDGHVLPFALPADPRHARARRIVRAAAAATRRLRSVVIHERLSASPGLSLWTTFRIVAPDRMTYVSTIHEGGTTRPGGQAIVIGGTRWDRNQPSSPWAKSQLQPLDQPVPDWRTAVDPSLLGQTAGTWRVSFRDPTVPAWFEVTIDRRTSHVLRVDMTAAAHFMVREWGEFNEPLPIAPPAGR
jgi:hypothetical protein